MNLEKNFEKFTDLKQLQTIYYYLRAKLVITND